MQQELLSTFSTTVKNIALYSGTLSYCHYDNIATLLLCQLLFGPEKQLNIVL